MKAGNCKINVTFYAKRFDKRLGEWYICIKVTQKICKGAM